MVIQPSFPIERWPAWANLKDMESVSHPMLQPLKNPEQMIQGDDTCTLVWEDGASSLERQSTNLGFLIPCF